MTSLARDADLISALPDVLLHQILGHLQAREPVQMCVLGRRWRNLWKSLPVLRVTGADSVESVQEFMDHLLLLRDRSELDACMFEFGTYGDADVTYVNLWIRHALWCQVRELAVAVVCNSRMVNELELDDLPIVSQYLTKLDLRGLILDQMFLDFSSCPALKNLSMSNCNIYGSKISSCGPLRHGPTTLIPGGGPFCCAHFVSPPPLLDQVRRRKSAKRRPRKESVKMASGADRLSALPDDLLHHVLSFPRTRCCGPPCSLAAGAIFRKSAPALRVTGDKDCTNSVWFLDFVDYLLLLRDPEARLDSFNLDLDDSEFSFTPLFPDFESHVTLWFRRALLLKAQSLSLRTTPGLYKNDMEGYRPLPLPDVPILSRHLRRLDLEPQFISEWYVYFLYLILFLFVMPLHSL
ncbi:hypothetical protein PR202_ga24656 [Eleusine coracana subsp. coracana]|uniref:F-box domain-containing protein n=1 Tax=Eleusine coracana subsp. coracana TaxID=191504 RepID=A0AAV5D7C7_ELECO|nr:hypothetical protein PR202_ga24656 [Eleusine coracana subsp. coracana]